MPEPSPAARPRRRVPWTARLALLAFGFGFAFVVAEAGFRVVAHAAEQRQFDDWQAVREQRTRERTGLGAGLGDMIYPSRHFDVIYEQLPNLDVQYVGHRYTTNADGFRGPQVARQKPPGVFRIVALGDSVMVGHGVDDGEEFVQVAANALNAGGLQQRVEVVNTAMSGYNTTMEVAMLETRGLEWQPDLVWIDFVRNDYSLPNFIVARSDFLDLGRSWLMEWALAVTGDHQGGFEPLQNAPAQGDGGFARTAETAPPEYRHHVGHDGYRRAMARLKQLQDRHGFAVLVTMHRYDDPFVREICAEHGFPFVRGNDAVDACMRARGIETYLGSELTVSDKDPHPSTVQHRILGELYADWIRSSGLVK
ncbi:MAG: SGNH/GDSL hydrolase family protein [Planctomycetota bacterium]